MKSKSIPAVAEFCLLVVFLLALCSPINAQTPNEPGINTASAPLNPPEVVVPKRSQSPVSADTNIGSQSNGGVNTSDPANPQGNTAKQSSSIGYVRPTTKERFHRYVNNTIGPFALGEGIVYAGINQWRNSPREWGQGADAFGKRFASSMGAKAASETTKYGLSEALKLDNAFYKSDKHGFWPRAKDAMLQSVVSRTTTGKRVFSAPKIGGYLAGGFVPLIWLPDRYGYQQGLRTAGYALLSSAGFNLVREFIFHKH